MAGIQGFEAYSFSTPCQYFSPSIPKILGKVFESAQRFLRESCACIPAREKPPKGGLTLVLGYREFRPLHGQYRLSIFYSAFTSKISGNLFEPLTYSVPHCTYLQLVTEKTILKFQSGFFLTSWDTGIRTPIKGFKGLCPTIRRYPKNRWGGFLLPTSSISRSNATSEEDAGARQM
jgi:hypothetical protein